MAGADEVIDLCSSDDEQGIGGGLPPVPKRPRRISASPRTPLPGAIPPAPASDDDDIEIVHVKHKTRGAGEDDEVVSNPVANGDTSVEAANEANEGDDDEDLVVVNETAGVRANVDYPHLRFSCGVHAFGRSARLNRLHCAKCFCYVCDGPASDCTQWSSHCAATDKQARWRTARTKARAKSGSGTTARKKTSRDYFVRRVPNRAAMSGVAGATSAARARARARITPVGGARGTAAAAAAASRMAQVTSAPTFQESVLRIIGQHPGLSSAAAAGHLSQRHLPHAAQVAGALDALDAALMLRWPPAGAPQIAPLELPPLNGMGMGTQTPGSAPSQRIAPLPSPNTVMGPISAPSTPVASSTLLAQIPVPIPAMPALAHQPPTTQSPAPTPVRAAVAVAAAAAATTAPARAQPVISATATQGATVVETASDNAHARIRPTFNAGPRLVPLAPTPASISGPIPPPVEPSPAPLATPNEPSATESPGSSPQPMQGVSRPTEPPKESTLLRREVTSPASSENSSDSEAAAESMRLRAQAAALEPLSSLITTGLGLGGPQGSTGAD